MQFRVDGFASTTNHVFNNPTTESLPVKLLALRVKLPVLPLKTQAQASESTQVQCHLAKSQNASQT